MLEIIDTTDRKKTTIFVENVTDLLVAQRQLIDTVISDHTQTKPTQSPFLTKGFFCLTAPLQKFWECIEKVFDKKENLEPAIIRIAPPKPEETKVDQKFKRLGFATSNWTQRLDANYKIYSKFYSLYINRKKGFPRVKDQHVDLFLANLEFIEGYQKMMAREKISDDFKTNLKPIAKDYVKEINRINQKNPRL